MKGLIINYMIPAEILALKDNFITPAALNNAEARINNCGWHIDVRGPWPILIHGQTAAEFPNKFRAIEFAFRELYDLSLAWEMHKRRI
jgi:hypothetical protein